MEINLLHRVINLIYGDHQSVKPTNPSAMVNGVKSHKNIILTTKISSFHNKIKAE